MVSDTRQKRNRVALEPGSSSRKTLCAITGGLRLLRLLAVAFWLAGLSTPLEAEVCPPGPNLADTDGNGLLDYACVGDWNNNGVCEMEGDIQTAVNSLNDSHPKMVLVDECNYAAPAVAQGLHGIISLPSNTTLKGLGPGTVLNGFVDNDVQSQQAVITNASHLYGNFNIVVSDLRIDGGWRGGDDNSLQHARMGIRFTTCTNCRAERLVVTDTLHACLYSSNGTGIEFLDSTLQRCGNYDGQGSHFPCVYIYAHEGGHTQDVLVRGIDCDGSGSTALTTRRGGTDSTLTDLVFQDNIVRNTAVLDDGARHSCITISGVGSGQYLNNTCIDTGGLSSIHSDAWYSDETHVGSSANVLVDGLHVSSAGVNASVFIRKYTENFTLRNITVNGTAGAPCLSFEPPLRNFSLDGADLSDCGEGGIYQHNVEASGVAEDERLTFRNIAISSAGTEVPSDGLQFRGPVKGLLLDNVTVDNVTGHGLRFDERIEDSTISNLTISNVDEHGIYLRGDTRNVALTLNEIDATGSDCIHLEGTPAPAVSHRQTSITGSEALNCAGRGIAIGDGDLLVEDLQVNNNTIDGVDGDGIEVVLAGSQSGYVEVQHNFLRDIGKRADGAAYHGIELSGKLTGAMVSQNTIEDWSDQATHGIHHDLPGSHPSYLCNNSCSGTLTLTECLHDASDPAYETDADVNGTVDACEDDDGDGVYGTDDNCPDDSNPLQTDTDLDGLGDICDNCAAEPNPTQSDFDSDSEGDLCDLDDGLIYVRFHDTASMSWQLEEGFDEWNTYRGDLTLLAAGGDHTQQPGSNLLAEQTCGLADPSLEDEDPLGSGQVAFYLVTGVQDFNESSLGHDSSGLLRPNAFPCPGQLPFDVFKPQAADRVSTR